MALVLVVCLFVTGKFLLYYARSIAMYDSSTIDSHIGIDMAMYLGLGNTL